jgi:hypothetical protein
VGAAGAAIGVTGGAAIGVAGGAAVGTTGGAAVGIAGEISGAAGGGVRQGSYVDWFMYSRIAGSVLAVPG